MLADFREMNAEEPKERTKQFALRVMELIVEDKILPEKAIASLLTEANELVAIMAASHIFAGRNRHVANSQSAIRSQKSEIRI